MSRCDAIGVIVLSILVALCCMVTYAVWDVIGGIDPTKDTFDRFECRSPDTLVVATMQSKCLSGSTIRTCKVMFRHNDDSIHEVSCHSPNGDEVSFTSIPAKMSDGVYTVYFILFVLCLVADVGVVILILNICDKVYREFAREDGAMGVVAEAEEAEEEVEKKTATA